MGAFVRIARRRITPGLRSHERPPRQARVLGGCADYIDPTVGGWVADPAMAKQRCAEEYDLPHEGGNKRDAVKAGPVAAE